MPIATIARSKWPARLVAACGMIGLASSFACFEPSASPVLRTETSPSPSPTHAATATPKASPLASPTAAASPTATTTPTPASSP